MSESARGKGFNKTVLGITGGIATGKSTVAHYLAQAHAVPILDADDLARKAVAPGSEILQRIQVHFGPGVLDQHGALRRETLGNLVFNNPQERQWLESQIHPFVRQQLIIQAQALLGTHDQVVMVIPLLFEAAMRDLVDLVWVVALAPELQLSRLMARNHLTLDQAIARVQSQMPLSEKIKQADWVFDNQGTLADLYQQIDQAWGHVGAFMTKVNNQ
ncbi:dephospho-CoA kinase [Thermosynechococcaceae cyanobacterium BACA0444]|uniref:Dephospho-CoA kinase n=1 Tax=Pseudocalidococcus azoricus BACA0444 TaxID=2918990 RepID=A0AAE4FU25_9CYAN|nr:dephospho-CoA kinase [Pseudocalidococcus azoricus]MDS3862384.1 dephospho-CoA kinase [Pseudocalidococcus azoricus BACA0444]